MALTETIVKIQKSNSHKKGIHFFQNKAYKYIFIEAPKALKK